MKTSRYSKKILIIMSIVFVIFISAFLIFNIFKKDFGKNKINNELKENVKKDSSNSEIDKIESIKENIDVNISEDKIINDKENESNSNNIQIEEKKDNVNNVGSNSVNQDKIDKPISNNAQNINKPNNTIDNNFDKKEDTSDLEVEKPNEEIEEPPVVEDKNDIKRKTMEKNFGIKIQYGEEMGDYKPKNITPVKLTDSSDIENYLNKLNSELLKYPKGFFDDFNKKGMPLTIYLIKSANGAFSGFTDYQFMNNIKLTLATDFEFEYTIHHEIMHYIDCYLDIVMYPKNPYDEYELLNPSGFVYGNATSSQIYNMGSNPRGAYFISNYGSVHVKEDRAEVFKYMIARAYAPIGCFEPNEFIRKKAEIISKQIKNHFPSVTTAAHWDRFIS